MVAAANHTPIARGTARIDTDRSHMSVYLFSRQRAAADIPDWHRNRLDAISRLVVALEYLKSHDVGLKALS